MKIVVTGAEGFIGSHLVPALEEAGHCVTRIIESGKGVSRASWRSVQANVVSGEGLDAAFEQIDGVIHLAARNRLSKGRQSDALSAYRHTNVDGTRNVIRAAARARARWFIHFSSVKVFGEGGDQIFDENSPYHPVTPYGISKMESEGVVRHIASDRGLSAVILRLPMVFGPKNAGNLPRMIRWAVAGLPFPLIEPENLRSMVYVGNVVHGVFCALENARPGISTYILKDAEDYSMRTLYGGICGALGKSPAFVSIPSWTVNVGEALSGQIRKIVRSFRVSSLKAQRELGYAPPFSLDHGIRETVKWYRRPT